MNVLWQGPHPDLPSRRRGKSTLKNLMITLTASHGGGVPKYGLAIDIGGELVHWKPTGEVVTIGGDHGGL